MWPFLMGFIASVTCYDLLFLYLFDNYFIICVLGLIAAYGVSRHKAVLYFITGAVVGCLLTYCSVYSYKSLQSQVPNAKVKVIGDVTTVPSFNNALCRFTLHTSKIAGRDMAININTSWFSNKGCNVKVGERWQLFLKIKPLAGNYSPRVADYAKNAMIMKRHASAYVIKSDYNKFITRKVSFLTLQDALWHKYESICPNCKYKSLVAALLFGITDKIDNDTWAVFQNTGTSHLFAISGLHVGIVGMMFFYIARWLWPLRVANSMAIASQRVGSIAALLAAMFYCAISGFGVPAMRSVIMLGLFLLLKLRGVRMTAVKILLLTSCIIGVFWPPVCWSKGFLLSFFAVFTLIFAGYTKTGSNLYNKYLHAQVMISIGLLPFTVLFWHKIVLASLPTNMLAIPVFSVFIVPLAFITMLLMPFHDLAALLAKITDNSLEFTIKQLDVVSHMAYNVIKLSDFSDFEYVLIFLGAGLLMMPSGFPARLWGLVLWLPMLYPQPHGVKDGDFEISVLDVGQGTAALIRTHKHSVLFDTGPAFQGGYSAGEKVIWPYLEHLGVGYLDYVIISHPDLDHKGGLAKLQDYVKIGRGYSTDPTLFINGVGEKCWGGQVWYEDGVRFEFVWPMGVKGLSKNNTSCVLKVSNVSGSMLLTGDIEKKGEALLLKYNEGVNLKSEILLAPHHGSRGSSSVEFIDRVDPKYVIFTTGKNNRFGFPKAEVLARYSCGNKTVCLNTADTGTIMLWQSAEGLKLDTWRHFNYHLWLE